MRILGVVLVLLAVVMFGVFAYCAETTVHAQTTEGTVTKIVPEGEMVVVNLKNNEGTETIYKLFKETKVTKGGKIISAKEILVTDKITVTKKGDVIEAVEVDVIPEKVQVTTKTGAPITAKSGAPVTSKSTETKK